MDLLAEEHITENLCTQSIYLMKSLHFGKLTVDPMQRVAICNDIDLQLSTREFDLLFFLASHPRQVFTLKQIYEGITKEEYHDTFRSVESSLYRLRKKLNNNYIENVRGYGYRFEPDAKG
jgi:two-component system phosphate regulon response regulator PhoB